jgi:hypothetical protein
MITRAELAADPQCVNAVARKGEGNAAAAPVQPGEILL